MSKSIVIIGAGLAGTVLANELSKDSRFKITVIEKGECLAPIADDKAYIADEPHLKFTRGEGAGGTSNYWHSGLIKMPEDCTWAEEILSGPGWYTKALELTGTFFPNTIMQDHAQGFAAIFYPYQRFKPALHNAISLEIGARDLKIESNNNYVSYYCSGVQRVIQYDVLIVSAGGIGTPGLLKDRLNADRFANPLIGRNLTDHISSAPMRVKLKAVRIMKFSKKITNGLIRKGWVVRDPKSKLRHIIYIRPALNINLKQHSQELRNKLIGFWGEKNKLTALIALASSVDILLEILANKLPVAIPVRYLAINVVSEQQRLNSNSVSYKDNELVIDWKFNDVERKSVTNACQIFLEQSGLDVEDFSIEAEDEIRFTGSCHHSGTVPFGDSPQDSVVDLDLLMHGFDNIYVCDGSVMPNTAYANTGLSIIALALRLAHHLKG